VLLIGLNQFFQNPKFLCGDAFTEADIRLFTSLIRFDSVYYVLFKCSLRHIYQYPNLWEYVRGIYQSDVIRSTTKWQNFTRSYFMSFKSINPFQVIPIGPTPKELGIDEPSTRKFDRTESLPTH